MPTTAETPKCFAEVEGRRLLDWTLYSLGENPARSLGPENICFVGGYQIEKVQRDYPGFTFRNNDNWQNNNILGSLFYAEDVMQEGFLCAYSDILFTPSVVAGLIESTADIALGVDTCWLERYAERTEHPPDDAEKVTVENGALTGISREIPEQDAHGEFIGVARFSPAGAALLKEHYHRCQEQFSGQPWGAAALLLHHCDWPGRMNGPGTVHAFMIRSCASRNRSRPTAGFIVKLWYSGPMPRTKPHTIRPPLMTSIMASSSATRSG